MGAGGAGVGAGGAGGAAVGAGATGAAVGAGAAGAWVGFATGFSAGFAVTFGGGAWVGFAAGFSVGFAVAAAWAVEEAALSFIGLLVAGVLLAALAASLLLATALATGSSCFTLCCATAAAAPITKTVAARIPVQSAYFFCLYVIPFTPLFSYHSLTLIIGRGCVECQCASRLMFKCFLVLAKAGTIGPDLLPVNYRSPFFSLSAFDFLKSRRICSPTP